MNIINIIKVIFLEDLIEFLDFYFHHFPKNLIRNFFDKIFILDYTLKLKTNIRNIKEPLYGDYSIVGYSVSIPYRFFSILIALLVYFFIFLFYLIFLLIWLIFPLLLIFRLIF